MSIIEQHHELVAKKVIENLKKRHMTGYYCKTPEEAVSLASSLIEKGSSVSWGGTMTISEIGMMDALRSREDLTLLDRSKSGGSRKDLPPGLLGRQLHYEHQRNHLRRRATEH